MLFATEAIQDEQDGKGEAVHHELPKTGLTWSNGEEGQDRKDAV
jgi:hypothetical protein